MRFINFDSEDAMGRDYVKEAVNTDFIQRAYYDTSISKSTIHLTFEGEASKYYTGSLAIDLYRHIQALPNFVEVPKESLRGSASQAVELINLNYALRLVYRDKANSEDGKSWLKIEYGMNKEIAERRAFDPSIHKASELTASAKFVELHGDKADEVWNKYQGAAL